MKAYHPWVCPSVFPKDNYGKPNLAKHLMYYSYRMNVILNCLWWTGFLKGGVKKGSKREASRNFRHGPSQQLVIDHVDNHRACAY